MASLVAHVLNGKYIGKDQVVGEALQAVAVELMGDHLSSCVSEAIEAGGPGAHEKIAEATEAIARLVRS